MIPHSYELPAALLLVLGGALSCFAGYRLFKITLAIYGFIFGAMFASSTVAASNTTGMILAAIGGGLAGALILVFAYFIGIALIGAGLGALVAHGIWSYVRTGDPPPAAVIVLAILGAIGAMLLQRYVIVVTTAFAGAWTLLLGGLAIANGTSLAAASRTSQVGDVWILYPTTPAPGKGWVPIAWILIGLVGTAAQLGITGKRKKK
jgi:uncharacterized protein DUF4203